MASRKDQKDAARQRRLAEERAQAERAARTRRLRMLAGTLIAAIIVIVVAIALSSGGGPAKAPKVASTAARAAQATVSRELAGIPQSGVTLGSPSAKVTVTEYGDLVCPVCKQFALSSESQLITQDVRTGKVKLVYKPLETASSTANGPMFVPSQTAVLAAGQQNRAWNYILLFYHEQGDETTSYVTNSYLQGLAGQIPGLGFAKWDSLRGSSSLSSQTSSEAQTNATTVASLPGSNGQASTPTIVIQGISQAKPLIGVPSFTALQSEITSVS